MSIKKSSIQQAILEAREIEKFATEKATLALQEEMAPKIKQIANEALKELESKSLNEGMNLEIPAGAELTIKMPDGTEENSEVPSDDIETETPENVENTNSDETTNNEENMSDIFEIEESLFEDDAMPTDAPVASAETPVEAPIESPVDAAPEAPTEEEPASIETIYQILKDMDAKIDAISSGESTEGGEEGGEGDVSIIEDEPEGVEGQAPAPEATPTPEPAPVQEYELEEDYLGEDMEDEVVYEVEDEMEDDTMLEYSLEEDDSIMEMFNEVENLQELEIVDEDVEESNDEEAIDEIKGTGKLFTSTPNKLGKLGKLQKAVKENKEVSEIKKINESINKIKVQYGSKVDELKQENGSLKQTIKEYKESFIVLRKQINEVQIFNAKLAYANKLFTNGGLTNDEKMKIAEEFDSVETIEEAKKLYNNFLNEMKGSKSIKTSSVEKLKSVTPAVAKPSNTQTLYESDEMRRMKRLAGIGKQSEE